MKKYSALAAVLIICVCVLAGAVGATAAIWEGEGGASSVDPPASVQDWNVWSKYFIYEDIFNPANPGEVIGKAVTGFSGSNLNNIIFPDIVTENGVDYSVLEIRNTVFGNTDSGNAREIPVSITVSPSITSIAPGAFSNLPNLKTLIFGTGGSADTDKACSVGSTAFAGCGSLKEIVIQGYRSVDFGDLCFMGCVSLTGLTKDAGASFTDATGTAFSGLTLSGI